MFERLSLRADRFIELAFAEVGQPEIVICLGEFAVTLVDRSAQRSHGAVEITRSIERPAKITERSREDGLLLDRQPEFFRRVVENPKVRKRKTEVVMRACEVAAPLLNRRAERGNRFRKFAAAIKRQAKLVMGLRKVLVLRDGRPERINRKVELLLTRIGAPTRSARLDSCRCAKRSPR